MNDSERLDKESASSAYRRRRCVGSANLVRALREADKLAPRQSPEAASGTRVHAHWAGADGEALSASEAATVEMLRRMEALVLTDWASGAQFKCLGREKRLWLHEGLEPIHSGAFDVAYSQGTRILILDGKTLYGEVSPAAQNDQLRELVALAHANWSAATEFTVGILQPLVQRRASLATYDQYEAELALRELRASLADAADPDAPRTAGPWCEYCPALEHCDTARNGALATNALAQQIAEGSLSLPIGARGAQLIEMARLAQTWIKIVLERYKEVLEADPDAIPGWTLRSGKKVREIKDLAAASQIALELMSAEQFYGALSLSVSRLSEALGKASGLKGAALAELFNTRFGDLIQTHTRSPEIARKST